MIIPGILASSNQSGRLAPFDSEALDYFTAVEAAGGIIDSNVKTGYNTLVTSLKDVAGIDEWVKIKELILPIHNNNASLTPALVKAKKKTGGEASLTATNFVAGDYTKAGGLKPNGNPGSAKKLETDLTPNDLISDNFAHIWATENLLTETQHQIRFFADGGGTFTNVWSSDFHSEFFAGSFGPYVRVGDPFSAGHIIFNATSSTSFKGYLRGVEKSAATGSRPAFSSSNAIVYMSTGSGGYSVSNMWMTLFGASFTLSNIPSIDAIFKTFLAILGRTTTHVVFKGDSLTFGIGTTGDMNYPTMTLKNTLGRYSQKNLGIAGETLETMYANRATEILPHIDPDVIFVLYAGVNDLNTGRTASAAYTDAVNIINYVKAQGVTRIAVGTVGARDPSSMAPAYDTSRAIYNTSIKDNASTLGISIIDFAGNTNLNVWNTTYYADDVHWNDAGAELAATIAAPIIVAVT